MATIVLKDPSLSSDTTVGELWRIRIPSPGRLGSYLAGDLRLAPIGITRRPALHGLLVQSDEGVSDLVVDRIDVTTAINREAPGITDSACKNQLVVVSIQYGTFNPYIPIRSTTIGKSRVAIDPIAMHTSWRSNSDIESVTSIGYPRMSASGESSTTMHRLLHASGSHPIPPPNDPKTNQYNQDLGLIHSTNGNHLECPNEGSSIDHQVTIHLHAQNITMFPTNETWDTASRGITTFVTPKPHFRTNTSDHGAVLEDERQSRAPHLSAGYLLAAMRRVGSYHALMRFGNNRLSDLSYALVPCVETSG
ncbi:hypothetical protein F511_18100 [Dorcoceras hygrometricum]|uniref:Uncharacterized protein n=1 Tax=Dorcoceras hygrometricum TaxID=472368 RepID=A0A2Z7BHM2_9LAMI|nr:hypothetical protein F511_18100 [Dorcoceras hygrometricum]